MQTYDVLDASYDALLPVVATLDDETGWGSTRCRAWTARDLVHHLLGDAQRALVALHTPASGEADVDAVTYWRTGNPRPSAPMPDAATPGSWQVPGRGWDRSPNSTWRL